MGLLLIAKLLLPIFDDLACRVIKMAREIMSVPSSEGDEHVFIVPASEKTPSRRWPSYADGPYFIVSHYLLDVRSLFFLGIRLVIVRRWPAEKIPISVSAATAGNDPKRRCPSSMASISGCTIRHRISLIGVLGLRGSRTNSRLRCKACHKGSEVVLKVNYPSSPDTGGSTEGKCFLA